MRREKGQRDGDGDGDGDGGGREGGDSAELRAILAPAKLDSMPMTRERWPYTVDH